MAQEMTEADIRNMNETLYAQLETPGQTKNAIDAVNDFTRTKMREEGFYRRIDEPMTINNDQLDRQVDTDIPVKVIDKEPNQPAAITVAFGTLPSNVYIRGNRYRVMFCRILSPRMIKDVEELRTYVMDIRQVMSDNSLKDMLTEEDSRMVEACNTLMIGPDVPVPYNGNEVLWETIDGPISRESVADALKILPRGPNHVPVETILVNIITIHEFMKFRRDEIGGDFAQTVFQDGWGESQFMGKKLLATIKRELIPDDSMFMFGPRKFLGKHFMLEQTTMYIKREAFMLEFFSYQTSGASIVGAVARADFA